ncbi:transketolase [Hoyosella sp. YIM 151337]|uniref:transketolase n=1 Tax=Hoyosella sp. YIM 151337 TaxID=2992742 RepID=UPI002236B1D5|nr:transketolase [Hoyosella sp. YIM 151337]MCW4354611.1 transketolase [Hoyosella sp. YIM 151337]
MVATNTDTELDKLAINTIRTLCIDAVQAANSGHPGTPMSMAPVVYTLWQEILRYDPTAPIWPDRDRFVLSVGHASTLLYSALHLTGVRSVNPDYEVLGDPAVSLDDLRHFRQLDSKCPGHPEYRWTAGVEATTGPLGTGAATSVGMAMAARWLAAYFNRPGFELFTYNTYVLCGDGDLMEGVAAEAASLAGHLKLANLCWIYDSNQISIEGSTELAFTEDVATRFAGHGWQVVRVQDANDTLAFARALSEFQQETVRPTLIIVDSHIGYGAPNKQGTASAHGEPLGEAEAAAAKRFYGWPEDEHFLVPDGVYEHFANGVGHRGRRLRAEWETLFERYRGEFPELAAQLDAMVRRQLPSGWDSGVQAYPPDAKGVATRSSSGEVLNAIAKNVPWLMGGSADLAPSTKTRLTFEGAGDFGADNHAGRNIHFGVREFLSAAVANGLALSKIRAYWSTFLIFSDFARGAIRLSALMELPVIHVFTHDSIGVGEDGPTHQPVEQLASLRAIPGLDVFRPCDANEVVETWRTVLPLRHEPAAIVLTRQNLPTLDRDKYGSAAGVASGAYVLADPPGGAEPEVIVIATGSEVHIAVQTYEQLTAEGARIRVVSMPCQELFDRQPEEYRRAVLPPHITERVAIEKASTLGWDRYTGFGGSIIGMHTFGASAPLKELQTRFGFTPENLTDVIRTHLAG